jgi:hypothetical protein
MKRERGRWAPLDIYASSNGYNIAIQIWSSCRTNLQPERLATNPHRDFYMLTIRQPGDEIDWGV